MNKKAFIFDLDGVIVDTAKYHFLAWQKLAQDIGINFTSEQNEQLKGVSRIESLNKILSWGNKTLSETEFEHLITKKNENYLSYIANMDESEILPDVKKLLTFLTENKYKISLGSASKNSSAILDTVNLKHLFPIIVDGNSTTKSKPDPEVFLIAASLLNADPKDCIVFEDSVAGIQAANKVNMISIGIGEKSVLHEANFVFKDFTEISIEFIKELNNVIA